MKFIELIETDKMRISILVEAKITYYLMSYIFCLFAGVRIYKAWQLCVHDASKN